MHLISESRYVLPRSDDGGGISGFALDVKVGKNTTEIETKRISSD